MSAGRSSATGGRRRRRTPEVAEQEILNAAEALLRERPFRELTVDEVMRRTELSRPSFYVYFRDRHHLILRIVERLGGEHQDIADVWYGRSGTGPEQIREAVASTVAVWERDGPVLHALADAAADDPDVEHGPPRDHGRVDRVRRRATSRPRWRRATCSRSTRGRPRGRSRS